MDSKMMFFVVLFKSEDNPQSLSAQAVSAFTPEQAVSLVAEQLVRQGQDNAFMIGALSAQDLDQLQHLMCQLKEAWTEMGNVAT